MLKKGKTLTFQSCYDKLGIRRLTKRAQQKHQKFRILAILRSHYFFLNAGPPKAPAVRFSDKK